MVEFKLGQWRKYEGIAGDVYYIKILSLETKLVNDNVIGFRMRYDRDDLEIKHWYFAFTDTESQYSLITLKDILLIPFPIAIKVRLQIKEILEWLSLELRPAQDDLFDYKAAKRVGYEYY